MRDKMGYEWSPWGTPLDLVLDVVSSEELRKVRGVVEEMDKRSEYDKWCGADLTLIVREIDGELMCRREGGSRMEMKEKAFLNAQLERERDESITPLEMREGDEVEGRVEDKAEWV